MALAWTHFLKNQAASLNGWHYRRKLKMTIDFKGIFRIKNHQQLKINNLERMESRRWVKVTAKKTVSNIG